MTILPTQDSGFVLGGSGRGPGGDISGTPIGAGDIWMVKIDKNGSKLWDWTFGTTSGDGIISVMEDENRGFVLASPSLASNDGDKSQPNWDVTGLTTDYWMLKIDSGGHKLWDRRFGGNGMDILSKIVKTADKGYFLAGYSNSDSSGDKTQNPWNMDSYDYWVVKIDSLGNKEWDRRYGGSGPDELSDFLITKDNGYLLMGRSGGNTLVTDKSDTKAGFWIVRIDSVGNKLWDKTIAPGLEKAGNLWQTQDGGFLLSGSSQFNAMESKSEDNLGQFQTWVVKTDSLFNKQWDKTILTPGSEGGFAVETDDGCYVVANDSWYLGGYKSQDSWDSSADYWLMKFCMGPVSVPALGSKNQIAVYPNPVTTDVSIHVEGAAKFVGVGIFNTIGEVVYQVTETDVSTSYTKMLDVSFLPRGFYIVQVAADNCNMSGYIVKE